MDRDEFAEHLTITPETLDLMERGFAVIDPRVQLLSHLIGQAIVGVGVSRFGQGFAIIVTSTTPGIRGRTRRVYPPVFKDRKRALAVAEALADEKRCDLDRRLRQA